LLISFTTGLSAQTFSSGSTGADGALNVTQNTTIQLPASGTLNYTTVNVSGATLSFALNAMNTPVTILATGAVTITQGTITVSAGGSVPGPGGFYGGAMGQPGLGPAPGQYGGTGGAQNGQWVGPLSLVPIIGGSGGAGPTIGDVGIGGSGGGAILIASSASISVTEGNILANGSGPSNYGGGTGANGAIRLVSNSVNVSLSNLQAAVVRVEAPAGSLTYTGNIGTTPVTAPINPVTALTNPPTIAISSVGGYPAPPATSANWGTINLLLPTQLQDPITVIVQAQNVPVGSQVTLMFSGSNATASPATTTLSGTTASSSATFAVSGLSRSGVTVLSASATFSPSQLSASLKQFGPDAVDKVELAAALGRPAKYRFLRKDGTEVSAADLSPELKRMFGY
jgi:hypothetical protein